MAFLIFTWATKIYSLTFSDIEKMDYFIKIKILEFLDLDSLQAIKKTGDASLSKSLLGATSYVREHFFDVTLEDGSQLTLGQFIKRDDVTSFSEIRNICTLMDIDKAQSNVGQLMAKTYQKMDNSVHLLAVLIIEIRIWAEIIDQASLLTEEYYPDEISDQFKEQLVNHVHLYCGLLVRQNLSDQTTPFSNESSEYLEFLNYVSGSLLDGKIIDLFKNQSANLLKSKFYNELDSKTGKKSLDNIVVNLSSALQFSAIEIRKSNEFEDMFSDFKVFLANLIEKDQALAILNRFEVPEKPENSKFVNIQRHFLNFLLGKQAVAN